MPRKIYDIKPPKVARKAEKQIKEFFEEEKSVRKHVAERKPARGRSKESGNPFLKPVLVASAIVLVIATGFLYFELPRVDVKIWPKIETLSFQQTITADKSVDMVDTTKNVIPAKYLETVKTASEDFSATGNASNEGKASGTITVYNKLDPVSPMTLKAGTRFLSDSSKLFVSVAKIVIPAGKKSGSKITPGSIQVKVEAAEGGDSYNIAPANFSVPGLKGSAYYFAIYATSSQAMTGGYSGKVKKVTDDDIQTAKDALVKKLTEQAIADLKSQISSDYILLDNAVSTETTSASTQTKVGTVTEKFAYQATIKAKTLVFKKSDLEEYAKDYIISQMPDGKTLLDGSLKTEYSSTTADVSGGKMTLSFNFSSDIYKNIDKNSLSLSLLGENSSQISQTIGNNLGEEVSSVKISFWPFWVSSAPKFQKAVHITLEFK